MSFADEHWEAVARGSQVLVPPNRWSGRNAAHPWPSKICRILFATQLVVGMGCSGLGADPGWAQAEPGISTETSLHTVYDALFAIHCRASIGRSSLLLAALLTAEGLTPDDAFRRLTVARGLRVPDTPDQVRWVERFAAAHKVP